MNKTRLTVVDQILDFQYFFPVADMCGSAYAIVTKLFAKHFNLKNVNNPQVPCLPYQISDVFGLVFCS